LNLGTVYECALTMHRYKLGQGPQLLASIIGALALLDDIATSDASMGMEDVEDLCGAREILAEVAGRTWNADTGRYTDMDESPIEDTTDRG